MYFLENLPYDKTHGFGTASFTPVTGILQAEKVSKNDLVETEGIEPSSEKLPLKISTSLVMFVFGPVLKT